MKSSEKQLAVSAVDPRGKRVHLSKERFDDHINGRSGHLGIPDIRVAIEQPNFILQDSSHETRQGYYNRVIQSVQSVDLYHKVVVDFPADSTYGDVVTAYVTKSVKNPKPEDILWQRG